jgi:hypothetical protein
MKLATVMAIGPDQFTISGWVPSLIQDEVDVCENL